MALGAARLGVRRFLTKSTLGGEASWAGAGMLAPGGEMDEPSDLTTLALESRRLYPAFVRELAETSGLAIDFQELGAVDLAYSAEELAALEARAARQAAIGIESKPLLPARVTTFWPRVRKEALAGARFYPGDGLVNPREIVLALAAVCRALGVRLVQNCAVQRVEDRERDVLLTSANGEESFDSALVAAGAWSGLIQVAPTAIPPSSPVKGHLLGYQQPTQTCNTIVRHGHTYLMQRANGFLIVGASVENVGFDRHIDAGEVARLVASAGFVMPHLLKPRPRRHGAASGRLATSCIWGNGRPAGCIWRTAIIGTASCLLRLLRSGWPTKSALIK